MNTILSNALDIIPVPGTRTDLPAGWLPEIQVSPTLEDLLKKVGPLPKESLLLGQAEDDLPVLLNMYDTQVGPLLIAGKQSMAKTLLLKSIANFVTITHTPQEIQFGVISQQFEEWQDILPDNHHCIGVFGNSQWRDRLFIRSLAMWLTAQRQSNQITLVLIDGLEQLRDWDETTRASLLTILTYGPQNLVWPIVTMNPTHDEMLASWLGLFKIRLYEYGLKWDKPDSQLYVPDIKWSTPVQGPWFMYKSKSGWLRFQIPLMNNDWL